MTTATIWRILDTTPTACDPRSHDGNFLDLPLRGQSMGPALMMSSQSCDDDVIGTIATMWWILTLYWRSPVAGILLAIVHLSYVICDCWWLANEGNIVYMR